MKVAIASDHAGFEQKQVLASYLREKGFDVMDLGPETDDRVDYPDFASALGREISAGTVQRGVLVCGTGIGMAIAACKVPGVRAANITRPDFAVLCREHNDANVVTLSGRFVSVEENEAILDAFFETEFAGGRHAGRVEKINALD